MDEVPETGPAAVDGAARAPTGPGQDHCEKKGTCMQDDQQEPVNMPAPVRASGIMAFVLEVALLCAAALWAIRFLAIAPVLAILVVVVPLLVFWGLFLSPQARFRFAWPVHPFVTHGLFVLAVIALFVSGHGWFGALMLVLTAASAVTTWLKRADLAAEAAGVRENRTRPRPEGRRAAR